MQRLRRQIARQIARSVGRTVRNRLQCAQQIGVGAVQEARGKQVQQAPDFVCRLVEQPGFVAPAVALLLRPAQRMLERARQLRQIAVAHGPRVARQRVGQRHRRVAHRAVLLQRPLGQLDAEPARQLIGLEEVDVEQRNADAQRADLAVGVAVGANARGGQRQGGGGRQRRWRQIDRGRCGVGRSVGCGIGCTIGCTTVRTTVRTTGCDIQRRHGGCGPGETGGCGPGRQVVHEAEFSRLTHRHRRRRLVGSGRRRRGQRGQVQRGQCGFGCGQRRGGGCVGGVSRRRQIGRCRRVVPMGQRRQDRQAGAGPGTGDGRGGSGGGGAGGRFGQPGQQVQVTGQGQIRHAGAQAIGPWRRRAGRRRRCGGGSGAIGGSGDGVTVQGGKISQLSALQCAGHRQPAGRITQQLGRAQQPVGREGAGIAVGQGLHPLFKIAAGVAGELAQRGVGQPAGLGQAGVVDLLTSPGGHAKRHQPDHARTALERVEGAAHGGERGFVVVAGLQHSQRLPGAGQHLTGLVEKHLAHLGVVFQTAGQRRLRRCVWRRRKPPDGAKLRLGQRATRQIEHRQAVAAVQRVLRPCALCGGVVRRGALGGPGLLDDAVELQCHFQRVGVGRGGWAGGGIVGGPGVEVVKAGRPVFARHHRRQAAGLGIKAEQRLGHLRLHTDHVDQKAQRAQVVGQPVEGAHLDRMLRVDLGAGQRIHIVAHAQHGL